MFLTSFRYFDSKLWMFEFHCRQPLVYPAGIMFGYKICFNYQKLCSCVHHVCVTNLYTKYGGLKHSAISPCYDGAPAIYRGLRNAIFLNHQFQLCYFLSLHTVRKIRASIFLCTKVACDAPCNGENQCETCCNNR